MKAASLTIRPREIKSNKITSCAQLAAALREWQKRVPVKERLEIARRIKDVRIQMNHEHLH